MPEHAFSEEEGDEHDHEGSASCDKAEGEGASEPPLKRRRLRGKQPAPFWHASFGVQTAAEPLCKRVKTGQLQLRKGR
eukprot:12425734-Karenia_brevis.AAC.1